MEKQEFSFLSVNRRRQLHAVQWIPDGKPQAVVQLCHGVGSCTEYFGALAEFLADNGNLVIGQDHFGQGQSVSSEAERGLLYRKHGNELLIADFHRLRKTTQKKYPNLPYFVLGEGTGSFLVRQYIELHGEDLSGAVVIGSGMYSQALLDFLKGLCRTRAALHGWNSRFGWIRDKIDWYLNRPFAPARTQLDWLTKDVAEVNHALQDPLREIPPSISYYYHLLRAAEFAQDPVNVRAIPDRLPIFLISGEKDPVGGMGSGVHKLYQQYRYNGVDLVKMKLYPNDRHALMLELDRRTVMADIQDWLLEVQSEA